MAGLTSPDHHNALKGAELLATDWANNELIRIRKAKKAPRGAAETNAYYQFTPLIKDVAAALLNNSLPNSEYPYMR
jgi:hypothetical protein